MMKASLGVGAMFPWKIDLTSEWNLKAGTFPKAKPISTPFPSPLSFPCALCCVVPTAEMIMDIGNL